MTKILKNIFILSIFVVSFVIASIKTPSFVNAQVGGGQGPPASPDYGCHCGPTGVDPASSDPAMAGTQIILPGASVAPGTLPGSQLSFPAGQACPSCGGGTVTQIAGGVVMEVAGEMPEGAGLEFLEFLKEVIACGNPCGSVCGIVSEANAQVPAAQAPQPICPANSCPSGLTCGSNNICLPTSCASNPGSCSCTALFQPPSVPAPSCQYISVLPNTTSGGSPVFNAGWSYTLTEVGSAGQPPVVNTWSAACQGTGQLGANPAPPPPVSGTFLSTSTNPVYWTAPTPIPPARLTSCTINVSGTDALGRSFSCPALTQNWVDGGVPPTPTVAPSPKIIPGVVFFDKNGDGRQDPATEKECYTGDITVTATTSDGLTPFRIFITKFRSDASCPQYALPVDDQRNYKVEISGFRATNFLTGWNNGCNPYTPDCFGTTPPFAVPIYLLTPSIFPPTLTPTTTPFTPIYPSATPIGYREPDPYAYLYPTSTPVPPTPTPNPSLMGMIWDTVFGWIFPSPTPTATPRLLPTATPIPTTTPLPTPIPQPTATLRTVLPTDTPIPPPPPTNTPLPTAQPR